MLPMLYSRTSKGQIQTWQIIVVPNGYKTVEGILGGALTESKITICKGKNTGKANETTNEEQAKKEAAAKYKKKLESGYHEDIKKIDESKFFEPMLAHKYNDYKDELEFPLYSNPKMDGMRLICNKTGMFSRNGKAVLSAPHIGKSLEQFFVDNPSITLDGELFSESLKYDFNKIISLARKTKPTAKDLEESKKVLEYWVFDLFDSKNPKMLYRDRFQFIQKIAEKYPIIVVPSVLVNSQEELDTEYQKCVEEGHEGQMIRDNLPYENKRSKSLLKRKDFIDEEFTILDIEEGKGNRAGLASNGTFILGEKTFRAGVIGNEEYARNLLKNKSKYIGKQATVVYQNKTPDGVPRFPKMKIIRDYE